MAHGNNDIGINTAGTSGGGGGGGGIGGAIKGFLGGGALGGLGSLIGGGITAAEHAQTQADIASMAEFQTQNFSGAGGSGTVGADGTSSFQFDAQMQALQDQLGSGAQSMLAGGLFNDQNFQNAFQNNDIQGALSGLNSATDFRQGSSQFGQLGNLAGTAQNAGNFATNQFLQGPQDFGQQGFLSGAQNAFTAAQDQQGIFDSSLAAQRGAAQQQNDRNFSQLMSRQFATGQLGSTGGGQQTQGLFDAFNQQDLGFQNNAFDRMLSQQNFLSGLGGQMGGLGANLNQQALTQNMQFGQQGQGFLGQAGGFEGQAFNQSLQAGQFNTGQANTRLNASLGLFGMGNDVFGQNFGLGLGAGQGLLANNQFGLESMLGFGGLANDTISATGEHAQALASLQSSSGSGGGSGLGDLVGGALSVAAMFSDRRLKKNINRIGTLGALNWYEWDWTDDAIEMGIDQPTFGVLADEAMKVFPKAVHLHKSGYLTVNYAELV